MNQLQLFIDNLQNMWSVKQVEVVGSQRFSRFLPYSYIRKT